MSTKGTFATFSHDGEAECKNVEKVPEVYTRLFATRNVNSGNETLECSQIEMFIEPYRGDAEYRGLKKNHSRNKVIKSISMARSKLKKRDP